MSRRNIEERISAGYRQKVGKAHVSRQDLVLADHEMIDKHNTTAKILVAYNPLHGEPSKMEIERFVWGNFDQKVTPVMETARIHTKRACIELVVEAMRSTQAFDTSKKMAPVIAGKKYVDSQNTVWEVRSSEDGTKYLVRKSDENIDEILNDRRKFVNAGATLPSFRGISKDAGYVNAQEGDTVEFYQGTQPLVGKVTSIGKDNTVKVSVGASSMTIPRQSILRVIEHSPSYKKQKMQGLYDYFEKFLGPELAKKLTDPGDNAAEGKNPTNR